jgi:N-methylhydantoinase A/oxoprolinase/acetone carboxylase beta subunit
MKKYSIGVDIGGTNTDAVLVNSNQAIEAICKTATTESIEQGFLTALKALLAQSTISSEMISKIVVGTTHATNALLQQKDLFTVGVIRLAGNRPILPPCYNWPLTLQKSIYKGHVTLDGGFECHGTPITPFDKNKIYKAAEQLVAQGAESIAIVGVFSPLNKEQEVQAAEALREIMPDIPLTLSHTIGGIGFIERENSAILNCALRKSMLNGFRNLDQALKILNLTCPLYITQNNGTIISLEQALEFPVLTISAGPTNSFIGGIKLAGLTEGIIADIGGTSTDVGIVNNGFPRRSINNATIADISLNFSMPDVLSIALGGGSYVSYKDESVMVGPESSGRKVLEESLSFGGSRLTLTDIALAQGYIAIEHAQPKRVAITKKQADQAIAYVQEMLNTLVSRIAGPFKDLPVVLVGGGAQLLPKALLSDTIVVPTYAHVANAYGAALAEVASSIDVVVSLTQRSQVLEKLNEQVLQEVIDKGADKASVRIIDQQIIPYHYVPGNLARIIITAAGKQL